MYMKRLVLLFAGTILLGTLWFFIFRETPPLCSEEMTSTPYIGIVTALDFEADAFETLVPVSEVCTSGGVEYLVGQIGEKDILMFSSGVGPKSAEKVVRDTLSTFTLDLLLFSGIAGGVDTSLQLGETVVAREWLDIETGERVLVDSELAEKAELLEGARVVSLGATASVFVTDRSTVPSGASIVDMETATVALLAEEYGVPFLAFRSISDTAENAGTDETFHTAALASAKATTQFILESE